MLSAGPDLSEVLTSRVECSGWVTANLVWRRAVDDNIRYQHKSDSVRWADTTRDSPDLHDQWRVTWPYSNPRDTLATHVSDSCYLLRVAFCTVSDASMEVKFWSTLERGLGRTIRSAKSSLSTQSITTELVRSFASAMSCVRRARRDPVCPWKGDVARAC